MMILVLAVSPASAATKVFLLGGQSNMDGRAPVNSLSPPYNQPQTDVKIWDYWSGGGWADLRGGFSTFNTGNLFGPEVSFGHRLHEMFPNDDIYLIKYSKGGTSLEEDWNPDGSGAHYNTFKATANTALQDLVGAGLSPEVVGMIWMQGERDAQFANMASAYAANLTNLISTVRNDFSEPDMQFVVGRITTHYGVDNGNALVRAAQETVPGLVGNASWIDTDDLQRSGGHYGAVGQIDLGIRYAGEIVETPEPSTLVLLVVGLTGLALYAWRKRN